MSTVYQHTLIYRIICNQTGEQYIGHTTLSLEHRLFNHENQYDNWKTGCRPTSYYSCFPIIERGQYEIQKIEDWPCESNQDAMFRERHHIESNKCVNQVIPIYTEEERKQKRAERNLAPQSCPCGGKYVYAQRQQHLLTMKHIRWQQEPEAEVDVKVEPKPVFWRHIQHACPCGGKYTNGRKQRHFHTKQHIEWHQSTQGGTTAAKS